MAITYDGTPEVGEVGDITGGGELAFSTSSRPIPATPMMGYRPG